MFKLQQKFVAAAAAALLVSGGNIVRAEDGPQGFKPVDPTPSADETMAKAAVVPLNQQDQTPNQESLWLKLDYRMPKWDAPKPTR